MFFTNFICALCLSLSLSASYQDQEFELLKVRVQKALINSWCSPQKADLLMDLVAEHRPQICVEVGAFTGSSILPVAAALDHFHCGKVYAIDAWSNSIAIQRLAEGDLNKPWWAQVDMCAVHNVFKTLINTWNLEKVCVELPYPSQEAVKYIPDSIDILHLDGDYSEEGALQDVIDYLPRVRPGGYILLSNFYMMIKREQPKVKAFCLICESCDVIKTIENDNVVLFRKN